LNFRRNYRLAGVGRGHRRTPPELRLGEEAGTGPHRRSTRNGWG
jgi:hypothetical protein